MRAPEVAKLVSRPTIEAILVTIVAFCLLSVGQSRIPIINGDEARFAQAAREMLAADEYVVPTFGGVNRYDKPILIYWFTEASYWAFGVNEWAARLPSNLSGALLVGCLAWTARRRWGPGLGWLAGCSLLATPVFHVQARACTADLSMMLPTMVAMLALERIVDGDDGWGPALVLWCGLGVAVLAKGPIGPMVAASTLVALWALSRHWPKWQLGCGAGLLVLGWWRLGPLVLAVPLVLACIDAARTPRIRAAVRRSRPLIGLVILFLVVVPWAIPAFLTTGGEFFRSAVGHHVIERSMGALEGHGGFPLFYLLTAFLVALPWAGLLIPAIDDLRRELKQGPSDLFLVAWLVGPLVVFEMAGTKLVHYWMPAYPAGVLLVVYWLMKADRCVPRTGVLASVMIVLGELVLSLIGPAVVWRFELPKLMPLVISVSVLVGVGLVAGLWLLRRRPCAGLTVLALAPLVQLVVLFGVVMPALGTSLLGPRAAERVMQMQEPEEEIVVFKLRDEEVLFYLPLQTTVIRESAELDERLLGLSAPLVLARSADVERFGEHLLRDGLEVVDRVEGIDLGRGRWAEASILRRKKEEGRRKRDIGQRKSDIGGISD